MKGNNIHFDDAKFSALLRESRVTPALPPHFQQNVWRRIEDAESAAQPVSWLDALAALILRPRFAYAAVAGLLLAGVFLGVQEGWHIARHDAQMNYLASVAPHSLR
jgi:hypothetical protein